MNRRKTHDLNLHVSFYVQLQIEKAVNILISKICMPYKMGLHLEPMADFLAYKATIEIPLQACSGYESLILAEVPNTLKLLRALDRRARLTWQAEVDAPLAALGPYGGNEWGLFELADALFRHAATGNETGLPEWVFMDEEESA